ncbi:hypothetical protein GCM10010271_70940 [Streptomyces kurssanovii]|nr:hypothetical protein GCM10010271_70940 [Streptomyces kurssanovii]
MKAQRRGGSSRWAGGCTSRGAPIGRARSRAPARAPGRAGHGLGSRATKPGKRRSRCSAPTTAPTATSPPSIRRCGRTRTAPSSPSGSTWSTSAAPKGSAKNPERAEQRAAQLKEIDPDWNAPWPLDWQRHWAIADEADGRLPDITPGVTVDGEDLGRWIRQQAQDWHHLDDEQQQRLTALGIRPAEPPAPAPAAAAGPLPAALRRALAALAQYIHTHGTHTVKRTHTETVVLDGQEHQVKLGVWISNTKSRRDKLTDNQRAALANLGVEWA